MTYFPLDQLPKSMSLQRSLQNGMKGSVRCTVFLQIGHFMGTYLASGTVWGRSSGMIWMRPFAGEGFQPDSLASTSSPTKS